MLFARIISIFISALIVFPAFYLLRPFVKSRTLIVLGTAIIALNPVLVLSGADFMSEALFLPLGTLILALLVRMPDRPWFLVGSMALAGAAVAVRPDGVFFLPIALPAALCVFLYQYLAQKQTRRWFFRRLGIALLSLIAFAGIAAPALVQRAHAFGSPFDYGENSKYLVTGYAQVWSGTDTEPSLANYFTHTPPNEIARKFLIDGFGRVVANIILSDKEWTYGPVILPVLLPFVIVGSISLFTDEAAWVLLLTLAMWIPGLSLVYDVYRDPRHLWIFIPLTTIFAIAGIERVYDSLTPSTRGLFFRAIVVSSALCLAWTPLLAVAFQSRHSSSDAPPAWAVWAAAHLKGEIAITEGGDSLMQLLPDASIGGASMFSTYAPISGISVMRPGNLPSADFAWSYFHSQNVSYVVVGPGSDERPYLLHIGDPQYQNQFTPVYADFTSSPTVTIFKVAVTR